LEQSDSVPPSSLTLNSGIANLALALSKAQSKIEAPPKNKKVDFLDKNNRRVKYNYADLADCISAVREPLSANGLAVSHSIGFFDGVFGLKTILLHELGGCLESFYPLPDPKKDSIKPQEFGSALTYARRYSLCSLVGIASDDDDDGGTAPETKPPAKKSEPPPKPSTKPAPENHAPNAQLPPPAEDIPDPIPDYDGPPSQTPREYLAQLAEFKNIDPKEMADIIERVTNRRVKSVALTPDELAKVIKYVELYLGNPDPKGGQNG